METHRALELELGRALANDCGLSVQNFEVLLRLARSPERSLRMTDLAAQTTLTKSGLSRAVDGLEDAGLVARERCEADKRGYWARLTDQGYDTVRAAVPHHLGHLETFLTGHLDQRERQQLADLLRKIRDAVHPGAEQGAR